MIKLKPSHATTMLAVSPTFNRHVNIYLMILKPSMRIAVTTIHVLRLAVVEVNIVKEHALEALLEMTDVPPIKNI